MEFHEAALIFPIDNESIPELAEDIRKHGQLVPVELLDGKILDGRRRWSACLIAGVTPRTVDVNPDDPIAYVWSLNKHRRHLTLTQLGLVAAKASELYEKQAKERQKMSQGRGVKGVEDLPHLNNPGRARDLAGKTVGVSGKTVDYGKKVLKSGTPKVIAAVEDDKVAISTAARMVGKSPEEQDAWVENAVKFQRPRQNTVEEPESEQPEGERRGVGVIRANEAVNCLIRIPKNDALRKRGFQIVMDWIKANK